MSKVLVDRELLERITALLEWDGTDETTPLEFGAKCDSLCKELSDYIAQPAEAEGPVEMGSDAWMALHLLDRLDVSADEEPRVQQVEEIVRRMGAALSAVTAERDRLRKAAEPLEPVHGDELPPIGSKVLIHLASCDEWIEHTVAGYYAWGDLDGYEHLHRVFVRVRDSDGYLNARLLKDVRPVGAAIAAKEA